MDEVSLPDPEAVELSASPPITGKYLSSSCFNLDLNLSLILVPIEGLVSVEGLSEELIEGIIVSKDEVEGLRLTELDGVLRLS